MKVAVLMKWGDQGQSDLLLSGKCCLKNECMAGWAKSYFGGAEMGKPVANIGGGW